MEKVEKEIKVKSFWFGSGKAREMNLKQVIPFTPRLTMEKMEQIAFSKKKQLELHIDSEILSNIKDMIFTMAMCCKNSKSKKLTLNLEDLEFMWDVVQGKKVIK